jgi:NAD(P)-dependent dehydrogenase (short-subunit alcohol dehydrogenase family)
MDLGLRGKVALVTGAASGVGREIALTLAAEGASVAVNYRSSANEAESIAAEIKAMGGSAKAYQADVADFAAVQAMVATIAKDFGGLNILINNAGLAKRQRFVETTPEDWHKQIDASLYGAIHCCHAAAPHLEAAKNGRIVSVIGDSSRVGESGLAIVAAARAGVIGLMKSLAREFGRSGTTANTVSLGLVETAARQGLGRRQPGKTRKALSGAPARPAGRHRADDRAPGIAVERLDHRPGAQHQRRLQHGVRRNLMLHTDLIAPIPDLLRRHAAARGGKCALSRRADIGDLRGARAAPASSPAISPIMASQRTIRLRSCCRTRCHGWKAVSPSPAPARSACRSATTRPNPRSPIGSRTPTAKRSSPPANAAICLRACKIGAQSEDRHRDGSRQLRGEALRRPAHIAEPKSAPRDPASLHETAFILYTSGTTGRAKGVAAHGARHVVGQRRLLGADHRPVRPRHRAYRRCRCFIPTRSICRC